MKKFILALSLCLVTLAAGAQEYNWAFGVRSDRHKGEVTAKHALTPASNIEFLFGLPYGQGAYGPRFYGYQNVFGPADFSVKMLLEKNIASPIDGLYFVCGAGPYIGIFPDADYWRRFGSYLGLVATVGAEYVFQDFPLAISLDFQPGLMYGLCSQKGLHYSYDGIGIGFKFYF